MHEYQYFTEVLRSGDFPDTVRQDRCSRSLAERLHGLQPNPDGRHRAGPAGAASLPKARQESRYYVFVIY